MIAHLVVEQGRRRKVFQLRGPESIIGRSHGNTVRIPSSQVSRKHCRLRFEEGLIYVEDLGSVNGTFLNGQRLRGREIARPGDSLEIGPVAFIIEYDLTPNAQQRLRALNQAEDVFDGVDMLEALADGEVVDAGRLPAFEPVEDDVALALPPDIAGAAEEDVKLELPADLEADINVEPMFPAAEAGDALKPGFDFDATPWQLPDAGDLRDLLEQMEEGPADSIPPLVPPKKKPRN